MPPLAHGRRACGELSFERVQADHPGREPYCTDFIACRFCQAMYFAPLRALQAELEERALVQACEEQRRFTKSRKRQKS